VDSIREGSIREGLIKEDIIREGSIREGSDSRELLILEEEVLIQVSKVDFNIVELGGTEVMINIFKVRSIEFT